MRSNLTRKSRRNPGTLTSSTSSSSFGKQVPYVGELEDCSRKMLVVCHKRSDSMFIPNLIAERFGIDYIFTNDIRNSDFNTKQIDIFGDTIKTQTKFDMVLLQHCPFITVLGDKYEPSEINKMIKNLEKLAKGKVVLMTLSKDYVDMSVNGVEEASIMESSDSSVDKYSYLIAAAMNKKYGSVLEIRFKDEKKMSRYLFMWKL